MAAGIEKNRSKSRRGDSFKSLEVLILQGLVVHVEYLWNQMDCFIVSYPSHGFFFYLLKNALRSWNEMNFWILNGVFSFMLMLSCVFLFTDFIQLPSLPEHVSHFLFRPDLFGQAAGFGGWHGLRQKFLAFANLRLLKFFEFKCMHVQSWDQLAYAYGVFLSTPSHITTNPHRLRPFVVLAERL